MTSIKRHIFSTGLIKILTILALLMGIMMTPAQTMAADTDDTVYGFKVTGGYRYDDVRMCVASSRGTKGGMALDISFFTDIPLSSSTSVLIDIPVMRPILFGAAFQMLQFEPEMSVLFRFDGGDTFDLIMGPGVGVTLHYGPDYRADLDHRGSEFFALGPRVSGYLGFDFKRPDSTFNVQAGIRPYVSPLFAINDSQNRDGIVVGGMVEVYFRFK